MKSALSTQVLEGTVTEWPLRSLTGIDIDETDIDSSSDEVCIRNPTHFLIWHYTLCWCIHFWGVKLNCGELQCIMVVNTPMLMHFECQSTIETFIESKVLRTFNAPVLSEIVITIDFNGPERYIYHSIIELWIFFKLHEVTPMITVDNVHFNLIHLITYVQQVLTHPFSHRELLLSQMTVVAAVTVIQTMKRQGCVNLFNKKLFIWLFTLKIFYCSNWFICTLWG